MTDSPSWTVTWPALVNLRDSMGGLGVLCKAQGPTHLEADKLKEPTKPSHSLCLWGCDTQPEVSPAGSATSESVLGPVQFPEA